MEQINNKMLQRLFLTSTALFCLTLVGNTLTIARGDTQRSHARKTIEIDPSQKVPSVDLVVHPDAIKGWNLEAKVANFRFAPEHVNTAAKSGEGHAHLYLNGKKIARLYGSWYYLENLPPGKNTITIGLNANSHEAFTSNGKLVQDAEIINVTTSK